MAVTTTPAALLPLDAPLPQPRRYTLLDAAQEITPGTDRWQAGVWINGYPAGEVQTWDNCSEGTLRVEKTLDAVVDSPMSGAFTAYLGGSCTARSVGPRAEEYQARLRLAFQARESAAVERVFATGDIHVTLGAYLADSNMEALNGNTAVAPVKALRLLEEEIATVGNGMIHMTPGLATELADNGSIAAGRDNQMRTVGNGTLVVVGAGYLDVDPDSWAAPGANEAWAFASGPVGFIRSEIFISSGSYSESLDRSTNTATFIAERNYVLVWVGRQDGSDESHLQAGVLVNLDG